jgi:hypothetical protein
MININMQQSTLIQPSRWTALISFSFGTILFLIQLVLSNSVDLLVLGFIYVIIAAFINLIFVIALFVEMFLRPLMAEELMITLGILLLNIPIAMMYLMILFNY